MAPSHSKPDNGNGKKKSSNFIPPLTLIPEIQYDSSKKHGFKLRTNPTDADSTKFSFDMYHLDGSETLREALQWYKDMEKVLTGLNVTDDAAKHSMTQQMLRDSALSAFNAGVNRARTQVHLVLQQEAWDNTDVTGATTDAQANALRQAAFDSVAVPVINDGMITAGKQSIIQYMAPFKALQKQKRYLRRFCRKPADMSTRKYVNYIARMNDEEIPLLPPFARDQKLPQDEMCEIVLYSIPRSWVRQMDIQNFDPEVATLAELIDFCERMEASEEHDKMASTAQKGNGNNNNKKSKTGKSDKDDSRKYCLVHGHGSHTSDECHSLKKYAKGVKDQGDGNNKSFGNKTWKRKADNNKSKAKKELAAFIKEAVKEELNCVSDKKRKSDDDDSDNDEEVNAIDFGKLNFSDPNDLKIDSDDESFKTANDA